MIRPAHILDRRFLEATSEEIVVDFYAHRVWGDPKSREEVVDDDFDASVAEVEALLAAKARRKAAEDTKAAEERKAGPEPEAAPDVAAEEWETVADDRY